VPKTAFPLILIILLALLAAACAGNGSSFEAAEAEPLSGYLSGYDPQSPRIEVASLTDALSTAPARSVGNYELIVLDANNQPDPTAAAALRFSVEGERVSIELNQPLAAATAYIRFDGASVHPVVLDVAREDGVSLAVLVAPGLLAVGAAAYGEGLLDTEAPLATLTFAAGANTCVERSASISQSLFNIIQDDNLTPVDNVNGTATLHWLEYNIGDYDVNGEVNIADLTPIGQKFQQVYIDTDPDFATLEVIDGDGNGEINIADITPIGQNFQSVIEGYDVYRTELTTPDEVPGVDEVGRWIKVPNAANPAGPSAPRVANGQLVRQSYTFTDESGEGDFGWYVQPVGTAVDGKGTTGPKSEVVTLHVSPDGPPPAGLSFEIMPPASGVVSVNDEFYLAVKITDISELFSANVRFEYDGTLVEYVEGVPAYDTNVNFLEPPLFVDADDVDEAVDPYVLFGFNATQTQGTSTKSGDGYLAYIKFRALVAGTNLEAFRFPQASNFIYLWGEQYGVPIATPTLGSPQSLEVQ
jgi:hypothetical protein